MRRFIRASLIWLGIGVLIGVAMAFWPAQALVYRPAHMHANLLGFVSMMIFGVAYFTMPRFAGNALHSRRLASWHLVVANAGLALLVGAWLTRMQLPVAAGYSLKAGGALSAAGAGMFIYNIWRTVEPLRGQPKIGRPAGALPVLQRDQPRQGAPLPGAATGMNGGAR